MKNLKTLFHILTACGILVLIGTAGASDIDAAGISEVVRRGAAGVAMVAAGMAGSRAVTALSQLKARICKKPEARIRHAV